MAELRRPSVRPFSAKMPSRLKAAVRQAGYKSRAYDLRLQGKHPLRLLGTPRDPWPGDRVAAAHLLAGRFVLDGHVLRNPRQDQGAWTAADIWALCAAGAEPVAEPVLSEAWQDHLLAFGWLRDLGEAVDRIALRKRAEALILGWLDQFESWQETAWRPDLIGRRLTNWLAYAPLIMDTDDLLYRSRVLDSMARQARHLMHESAALPPGPARIEALAGLAQAGLYIPHGEAWLKRGLTLLRRELPEEVLPDGGVRSRNPEDVLHLLKTLVMLRSALKGMGHGVPDELDAARDRLAGHLRLLRHGDGRLALFNGGGEGSPEMIEALLSRLPPPAPVDGDALQSGFRRLEKAGTCLIADSGPPALTAISRRCHAGCLSFELSRRTRRLFVNCGSAAALPMSETAAPGPDLVTLSRTTAAHSALVLEDRNNAEILENGLIGAGPTVVTSRRLEDRGDVLLELSHDGYAGRLGYKHWRLIYMNAAGDDLRGEDILEPVAPRPAPVALDLRFHLHPGVHAHLLTAGGKNAAGAAGRVQLRLEDGEVWLFQARDGALALADSLYLGAPGRQQKTRQIVLSRPPAAPAAAQKITVKWSLRRVMDA